MPRKRPQKAVSQKKQKHSPKEIHPLKSLHILVNDDNYFYSRIKDYGLPVDNIEDMTDAAFSLSPHFDDLLTLKFAISESEKAEAARVWGDKQLDNEIAAQGLQGELEYLFWDDYISTAVVLYRERDKSFWVWNLEELRMVGYRWTDLIEPDVVWWEE